MKLPHVKQALFLSLVLAAVAGLIPVAAQEEDSGEDTMKPLGSFWFEFEGWIAQANGADLEPATEIDPSNVFGTRVLSMSDGTHGEDRFQIGWDLPNSVGTLVLTYYVHEQGNDLVRSEPGSFIFGETLTHPYLAGVNNDRLADAFSANSFLRLRDMRLDFRRQLHRSQKAISHWFIGWRRAQYNRSQDATYFATIPGFPVLLPPIVDSPPNLDPIADFAELTSKYEGRGINVGVDLEFPLWKDRLVLEGSVGISALRGKTDTSYQATNSFYFSDFQGEETLLGAPYDEFTEFVQTADGQSCDPFDDDPSDDAGCVAFIDFIEQGTKPFGLSKGGRSQSSQVLDTELGFRWRALKWLDVIGGFRMSRYDNVATDLRLTGSTTTVFDDGGTIVDLQNVTEEERSVTYEGFYGGVRIRLY